MQDLVSFTLGILSVVFFANCFLPQIILNFVNGSSEGLSVGMILVWSLGDLCNIIGVLLTGAVSVHWQSCSLCDTRVCYCSLLVPADANSVHDGHPVLHMRRHSELPKHVLLILEHTEKFEGPAA